MFEYNYKNKFSVSHNTKIIPNRGTYEQQKNRTWLGQLPIKAQCIIDLIHYYTTSMATLLLYKLATNAIHWGSHVPPAANTFLAPHLIGLISMDPRTPCWVSCWQLQLLYSYISAKTLFFFGVIVKALYDWLHCNVSTIWVPICIAQPFLWWWFNLFRKNEIRLLLMKNKILLHSSTI
jgi:hypothetical protein